MVPPVGVARQVARRRKPPLVRRQGDGAQLVRQIKTEHDNPTIGLLLCKSQNKVVAEYALGDKTQPMGIAEYKLIESLPAELQTSLPSIEQIEAELQGLDEAARPSSSSSI